MAILPGTAGAHLCEMVDVDVASHRGSTLSLDVWFNRPSVFRFSLYVCCVYSYKRCKINFTCCSFLGTWDEFVISCWTLFFLLSFTPILLCIFCNWTVAILNHGLDFKVFYFSVLFRLREKRWIAFKAKSINSDFCCYYPHLSNLVSRLSRNIKYLPFLDQCHFVSSTVGPYVPKDQI